AALVRRHGPMVWGVCRRVLHNHHDAEDAFQATFLVLVRKAACIMPREMVGNWLYGVAHRTALKARALTAKLHAKEKQVQEMPEPAARSESHPWPDLETCLDQELSRLPDKYRCALVLCDLEGKTYKEAAHQLGVPEGTLATRLRTARTMLAKRLARHGLALSAGALATGLSESASACVPFHVMSLTVKTATLVAAGRVGAGGIPSVQVAALTDGVIKAMLITRIQRMAAVLMALGLSAFAYGVFASGKADEVSQQTRTPPAANRATPRPADTDQAKATRGKSSTSHEEKDLIRPGDRLRVRVLGALPQEPIDGVFRVEQAGTVALGPLYGRVQVEGQTLEEAEIIIRQYLSKQLREPHVSVTRYDPLPDKKVEALEGRVRQLEKQVRSLCITVEELKSSQAKRGRSP
ncbi:MAG TPA: sigma-70 family RNA polymerase sigma factor, partial [Gemmataceae bacterium]|nr:sigma-70 family RNA polymerase sigma factor [Gemmataceae bacterium]